MENYYEAALTYLKRWENKQPHTAYVENRTRRWTKTRKEQKVLLDYYWT